MATNTFTSRVSGSSSQPLSVADIRQWGKGIDTAFAAAGLVAVTPLINWDTDVTTYPGTIPSVFQTVVWRFNDALQASCPVYLRVVYTLFNTATTGTVNLKLTIQVALDMTDNFSGVENNYCSNDVVGVAATSSALVPVNHINTARPSYVCGLMDDGYFGFVLALGPEGDTVGTGTGGLVIERTRGLDGTPNAGGILVHSFGPQGGSNTAYGKNVTSAFLRPDVPIVNQPYTARFALIAAPAWTTSGVDGLDVKFHRQMGALDGPTDYGPTRGLLAYWSTDLARGVLVPVEVDGLERTYLPLSVLAQIGFTVGNTAMALAMRYE